MSPVLRAAHRYVGELGWAVLPCIGKAPAVPVRDGGRGWASATRVAEAPTGLRRHCRQAVRARHPGRRPPRRRATRRWQPSSATTASCRLPSGS